jgi:hypothetical protein
MTRQTKRETPRTLTMPLLDDTAGDVAPLRRTTLPSPTPAAPPPTPRPNLVALALTIAIAAATVPVALIASRDPRPTPQTANGQLAKPVKQITDISTRTMERAATTQRAERRRLQLRAIRERRTHRRARERHDRARRQALSRRATTRAKPVRSRGGGRILNRPIVPAPRPQPGTQEEEFPF